MIAVEAGEGKIKDQIFLIFGGSIALYKLEIILFIYLFVDLSDEAPK